ncbi:unnamed protein product [Lathyrus oleraceus]|uniref:Root meristem growth factor 8 n=1 Tax=Pisum sativum TaxID=3888 RepID=A0A9D5BAK6_PEA|nr:uncharacterized protein LOC127121353 [Pisum sativum]KAI5436610.1 hypothetical protein KIW84_022931 [Pisum sativum]
MELIKIITFLNLFFSSLQPTFSSLQTQSHTTIQHQGILNAHRKLYLPIILHRKPTFTEKVKESDEAIDLVSHKKEDSLPTGKEKKKKQKMAVGRKGTRQEWMESEDPSEYFTMDYNRVKRRRPIHNK